MIDVMGLQSLCDRLNDVFNLDETPDELCQEAREAIEALCKLRDDCAPYLKDGETPAECIARNREDVSLVLRQLVRTLQRAEEAEARVAKLEEMV